MVVGTDCARFYELSLSFQTRDKLIGAMLKRGVHIGACGDRTIRFRPALILTQAQAELALHELRECLAEGL